MPELRVPSYLEGYKTLYAQNPRSAARAWLAEARFGLFVHYGLYSLLGRHEWVMYRERIPIAEYEALKTQFTAERFDADMITDLALEAKMRYVSRTRADRSRGRRGRAEGMGRQYRQAQRDLRHLKHRLSSHPALLTASTTREAV